MHASGDIAVIADDDVEYSKKYFNRIVEKYESNPDIDIACFKINTGEGNPEYKNYPNKEIVINSIKEHSPSSIEITFRLKPIIEKGILFDERFGLGTRLKGGEEGLFFHDCIQNNLKIIFYILYIEHVF